MKMYEKFSARSIDIDEFIFAHFEVISAERYMRYTQLFVIASFVLSFVFSRRGRSSDGTNRLLINSSRIDDPALLDGYKCTILDLYLVPNERKYDTIYPSPNNPDKNVREINEIYPAPCLCRKSSEILHDQGDDMLTSKQSTLSHRCGRYLTLIVKSRSLCHGLQNVL